MWRKQDQQYIFSIINKLGAGREIYYNYSKLFWINLDNFHKSIVRSVERTICCWKWKNVYCDLLH